MFWQLFYLLSKILTVNKWVKVEYESKVQTKIYKNLIIFEVKNKRSTFIKRPCLHFNQMLAFR